LEIAVAVQADRIVPHKLSVRVELIDHAIGADGMSADSGVNTQISGINRQRAIVPHSDRPGNRTVGPVQFNDRAVIYVRDRITRTGGQSSVERS